LSESAQKRLNRVSRAAGAGRGNSSERVRSLKASIAAHVMHGRHPEAAASNGAKGGLRTAHDFHEGAAAWARRMALARWHGSPFVYVRRHEDGDGSART